MYRLGAFLKDSIHHIGLYFSQQRNSTKTCYPSICASGFFIGTSGTTNHKCGSKIFRVIYYHHVLVVVTSFWALGM